MKTRVYIFLIFSVLIACSSEKKNKSGTSGNVISEQYNQILSGADTAWNEMMASEDRKIENIRLMVKELGLIEGSSAKHLEEINGHLEDLKKSRYDRLSMAKSNLIDRYDSLTNALIGELRSEINTNKEAVKYQVINQLMQEIQAADDSVLFLRKAYDRKIDLCKNFVQENRKKIRKFIPNPDSLKNLNYFRLIP